VRRIRAQLISLDHKPDEYADGIAKQMLGDATRRSTSSGASRATSTRSARRWASSNQERSATQMNFPPETATDARRHELLADLAEHVAQRLIEKHGMAEDAACDVGNSLADFLAEHWKGQTSTCPATRRSSSTSAIGRSSRRFERGNANELAREFNISKVRVAPDLQALPEATSTALIARTHRPLN
jgi:hypothetical protein